MRYIGVDPGKAGAIAAVDGDGTIVYLSKMPETESDLLSAFAGAANMRATAVLEEVRAFSPPGAKIGATSIMKMGIGYGLLRMGLVSTRIPFDVVHALRWQNALGCRSGGNKNVTKARAQELFPAFAAKVTHWNADALLLAEYCRRLRTGQLTLASEQPKAAKAARKAARGGAALF